MGSRVCLINHFFLNPISDRVPTSDFRGTLLKIKQNFSTPFDKISWRINILWLFFESGFSPLCPGSYAWVMNSIIFKKITDFLHPFWRCYPQYFRSLNKAEIQSASSIFLNISRLLDQFLSLIYRLISLTDMVYTTGCV